MRKLFEPLLPLLQLLEMLKERSINFHDKVVEARNLAVDDGTGNLVVRNGTAREYEWQPQAFSLLCQKLRVPASYASRCSAWLQAENFNTWLGSASPSSVPIGARALLPQATRSPTCGSRETFASPRQPRRGLDGVAAGSSGSAAAGFLGRRYGKGGGHGE